MHAQLALFTVIFAQLRRLSPFNARDTALLTLATVSVNVWNDTLIGN